MITGTFLLKEAAALTQPSQESHSVLLLAFDLHNRGTWQLSAPREAGKCCLLAKTGVLLLKKKRRLAAPGEYSLYHGCFLCQDFLFITFSLILLHVPLKYKIFTY